ncbi:hypothetical protein V2J09_020880 [Rumex salicifolius]
MAATNGLCIPAVCLASLVAFLYMSFGDMRFNFLTKSNLGFVERNGTQFSLDGKPFYINGWNSYWLMYHAVEDYSRPRISSMLQAGSKMGLTVCRTWAFNDGTYHALQVSPGSGLCNSGSKKKSCEADPEFSEQFASLWWEN